MAQFYFSVYKKSNFHPVLICLVLFLFSSVLNADEEKTEKLFAVPNPATDLWRAVRQGESGFISSPRRNSSRLIVGIPREDCAKAGNCTEQAVGFSLPIHALVPSINEARGIGGNTITLGFTLFLFASLTIAGLVFVFKLTRSRSDDVTAQGDSAK
ncbi:MAG: hypothetical protein GY792_20540 [Gammaproteobacteria bacterium]|nr:hypothetical protein [Gammaproteobacteria bacterium]